MQVLITGKNLDIGDSLRSRVEDKLVEDVEKYFDGAVRANVVISKQKSTFLTDCTLHLRTGLVLQAGGEGGDAHSSFDTAAEHLEKRLRRYKRRLKNHHQRRDEPLPVENISTYVIRGDDPDSLDNDPPDDDLSPAIIAEDTAEMTEMSLEDAVLQLELSTTPFVLFRNTKHLGVNVVYRRDDGQIGWVDPGPGAPH